MYMSVMYMYRLYVYRLWNNDSKFDKFNLSL